jgi:hypothetical protein
LRYNARESSQWKGVHRMSLKDICKNGWGKRVALDTARAEVAKYNAEHQGPEQPKASTLACLLNPEFTRVWNDSQTEERQHEKLPERRSKADPKPTKTEIDEATKPEKKLRPTLDEVLARRRMSTNATTASPKRMISKEEYFKWLEEQAEREKPLFEEIRKLYAIPVK